MSGAHYFPFSVRTFLDQLPSCFQWENKCTTLTQLVISNFVLFLAVSPNFNFFRAATQFALYGILAAMAYSAVDSFANRRVWPLSSAKGAASESVAKAQNYQFVSESTVQILVLRLVRVTESALMCVRAASNTLYGALTFFFCATFVSWVLRYVSVWAFVLVLYNFVHVLTFLRRVKGIEVVDYIGAVGDIVRAAVPFLMNMIPRYEVKKLE